MKSMAIALISFFLAGIFVTAVFAAGETASSKVKQITGEVTSVDVKANTVTIQKKDRQITVAVEESTKITQCTLKTAITDLKIGDKVTARYKETGSNNTAKSIAIKEATEDDN